jgi:hypothetical protein
MDYLPQNEDLDLKIQKSPSKQQKWGPSQQRNGEFSNKCGDVQPT